MPPVSATRSEVLARRARIGLAAQGRATCSRTAAAVVREFHRLGASALASLAELADRCHAAASDS